jgi:hypothetical protein
MVRNRRESDLHETLLQSQMAARKFRKVDGPGGFVHAKFAAQAFIPSFTAPAFV